MTKPNDCTGIDPCRPVECEQRDAPRRAATETARKRAAVNPDDVIITLHLTAVHCRENTRRVAAPFAVPPFRRCLRMPRRQSHDSTHARTHVASSSSPDMHIRHCIHHLCASLASACKSIGCIVDITMSGNLDQWLAWVRCDGGAAAVAWPRSCRGVGGGRQVSARAGFEATVRHGCRHSE
jgi:hypothetical protein